MAGTIEGGRKAAETNRKKHGKDFYKRVGALGGKVSRGGGFAADPKLASLAGKIGGLKSRKNGRKARLSLRERMELKRLEAELAKLKKK